MPLILLTWAACAVKSPSALIWESIRKLNVRITVSEVSGMVAHHVEVAIDTLRVYLVRIQASLEHRERGDGPC